jgi:hypothetical protein
MSILILKIKSFLKTSKAPLAPTSWQKQNLGILW